MHFLEMLVFYYSIIGWTKEYLWLQFWLLLNVSSVIIKLWLRYNGALLDEYIYRCHEPKYLVVKISEN